MQTLTPFQAPNAPYKVPRRSRRFSPLFLIGIIVTLIIALSAGVFLFVRIRTGSHAAAVNMNCTLVMPTNPLTAKGLATPYQLVATDVAQGPCNENNANQSAFVQAVIFDPATSTLSAYEPLVIDVGTQPAIAPVAPRLPQGAIVGLWFGFNGTFLHLAGDTIGGLCVNGLRGSDFGQFAYCNAPRFFQVVNGAILTKKLAVPAIGMASDGQPCYTTRAFAHVDMDQSDNVQTQYLTNAQGQTAQLSDANKMQLQNATTLGNPSDNALLSRFVDPALGCQSWQIPDLVNNGTMTATLATDEIQAAANQQAPMALIPAGDEMVLVNNKPNLTKTNAYRIGVDQMPAATLNDASTKTYCTNLVAVALPRLQLDMQTFLNKPSPDGGATANSLFTFLANRLNATFSANGLNCVGLLNIQNPVTLTTDANGVVTAATLTVKGAGNGTGTGTGTGTTTTPNCSVNGAAVARCMGTIMINGQTCTLAFANNTVNLTCPNPQGNNGNGNGNNGNGNNGNGNNGNANANKLPFNNSGTSDDNNPTGANFDTWGNSYSTQALLTAGITPGKTITFNGVTFMWPGSAVGGPDNVQAKGQEMPITPVQGAKTLGFLGCSTNGPSNGNATITYTDGTTQTFSLAFSDWTLNAGQAEPLNGNQVVAVTSYRNTPTGMQMHMPHVFYTGINLQAGKTVKSVTLPASVNQGQMHVFGISTK